MTGSRLSGLRKDEMRRRLADLLRTNLSRRKIQQRERNARHAANMAAAPPAEAAAGDADHLPGVVSGDDEPLQRI